MTRMPGFGFIALWLSLISLTGCMSDHAVQKQQNAAIRQTDQKLLKSLERIRQSEQMKLLKSEIFRRNLALSFQQSDQLLTNHQEKITHLFFQTIPAESSLSIIITVAPTSDGETFKLLQKAWERLRSLEQQVSEYSSQIKRVYQPELDPDTATIQVIGG